MSSRQACSACGRALGARFLKAGKLAFHEPCFRCAHCQQVMDQAFTVQQGAIYHLSCYQQKFKLNCAHCARSLGEQWVTFDGKKLYQACYQAHYMPRCVHCGGGIQDRYHADECGHWHVACYEQVKLEPCAACGGPLKGQILLDPWGNRAHARHGSQKTLSCSVCARLVSTKTSQNGMVYGDGRVICGICQITQVAEPAQIQHARQAVLQALSAVGFDYIPDYLAVTLADQRRMNQRLGVHARSNSHGYTKTIEKRHNGELIREHSIYVLFGLPRLAFMGVLAHELLHVWLNDRGLQPGSEQVVEGFCNLGTALIYQNDASPLAQVLLQRMADDPDPVYGQGYRLMRTRL
ncbi:MAG: hypothetical protein CVV27_01905, partial [Candidatus Melainabacteria bacterium HGW-Melainabacteria-1]